MWIFLWPVNKTSSKRYSNKIKNFKRKIFTSKSTKKHTISIKYNSKIFKISEIFELHLNLKKRNKNE